MNSIKTFGNIVCFRNLQKRTDDAISLFGDKNALIIHGGRYNDGHLRLKMQHGFEICTIKEMAITLQCLKIKGTRYDAVFVDEAQAFSQSQINFIADMFLAQNIPIVLAFDTQQTNGNNISFDDLCLKYETKFFESCVKNNMRFKTQVDLTF